jgi:hypothetical protein
MTGAAVFNQALREVRSLELSAEAERDFVAALEAARPGPSDLFYALAYEASPSREELLVRAAGLFCVFASGNLADDLIDGECDYLSQPSAIGASVQFGLHHLGYAVLLRSRAEREAVADMAGRLARAGGAEHLEVGDGWTAERFMGVAEGIAGLQWEGYLPVLWSGASRPGASALGRVLGLALHLAEDIRSHDRRFCTLPDGDRQVVARWGLTLVETLRGSSSPCLGRVAASVEPTIQEVAS